jgi:uncharacterized protein YbaR (Trm112 family)
MKTDFICPRCRGYLNVGDKVTFIIRSKGWAGGILMLSPVLGDYSYLSHPSHSFEPGQQYEFFCPICHHDLSLEGSGNMAKMLMKEDDRDEFFIVFSKKAGERCTYKLSESKIETTYGEHRDVHIDLLNATFLK